MNVTIYVIVKRTGLATDDGVESVVLIDVKLTRFAAERVLARNPGSEIIKMSADKST